MQSLYSSGVSTLHGGQALHKSAGTPQASKKHPQDNKNHRLLIVGYIIVSVK